MTAPMKPKSSLQMREALCVFVGFAYLTNVLDLNDGVIPDHIKSIYNKATKIMLMYEQCHDDMIEDVNEIVRNYPETEIDLMLASVSMFSEYIEQMRGRKRTFNPMDYKHIREIQDEIEEELCEAGQQKKVFDTIDYCHSLVKQILTL